MSNTFHSNLFSFTQFTLLYLFSSTIFRFFPVNSYGKRFLSYPFILLPSTLYCTLHNFVHHFICVLRLLLGTSFKSTLCSYWDREIKCNWFVLKMMICINKFCLRLQFTTQGLLFYKIWIVLSRTQRE